jgi:hypothetical protein
LITVPSCGRCNNPESANDTYFRDALSMMAATDDGLPPPVSSAIFRSLRHAGTQFKTPFRSFIDGARPVTLVGEQPRSAYAFEIRWDRIKHTVARIVRGLRWHHYGEKVPDDFEVTVIGNKEREAFDVVGVDLFKQFAQSTLAGVKVKIHPDVFMYAYTSVKEDARMSVWTLCFFRNVIFVALVDPIGHDDLGQGDAVRA